MLASFDTLGHLHNVADLGANISAPITRCSYSKSIAESKPSSSSNKRC
jgi:hypothetical protein